jgi:membrane protein involved in colicin uptake
MSNKDKNQHRGGDQTPPATTPSSVRPIDEESVQTPNDPAAAGNQNTDTNQNSGDNGQQDKGDGPSAEQLAAEEAKVKSDQEAKAKADKEAADAAEAENLRLANAVNGVPATKIGLQDVLKATVRGPASVKTGTYSDSVSNLLKILFANQFCTVEINERYLSDVTILIEKTASLPGIPSIADATRVRAIRNLKSWK